MAKLASVDTEQRERIRLGLERYMEQHGIRDTILCQRIIHVLDVDKSAVPLSTLRRFIQAKFRTDDVMVRRYARFLSAVAPPPASDEFGAALAKFLSPVLKDTKWATVCAGDYRTYVKPNNAAAGSTTGFTLGCSTVRLRTAQDTSFLRATEFMVDTETQDDPTERRWRGNTGVFAPVGYSRYLMIVRSFLETRIYSLRKVLDAPLTFCGHAVEMQGAFVLDFEMSSVPKKEPVTGFVMTAKDTQNNEEKSPVASL